MFEKNCVTSNLMADTFERKKKCNRINGLKNTEQEEIA